MSVKSQKFLSRLSLLLLTGLAAVMLGCSSEPAPTPAGFGEVITEAAPAPTATPALPPTTTAAPPAPADPPAPRPTATPEPVPTAMPTAEPTPVPEPTATPAPTATPQPTATPLPPTPTPLPLNLLSPAPREFDIEEKQTFQLNTANLPDGASVWVGYNYEDDTGTLSLRGCPAQPRDGVRLNDGDTFTIKACFPGMVTMRLYRNGTDELLESYSVIINPSDGTASLSPPPEEFTVEDKQSFQVNTDLPDNAAVWVGVNYGDYTGTLGFDSCPGEPQAGKRFRNGDSFVLKACSSGTATVHLYRNGTDELLESYAVTVNPSGATASLSPPPQEFAIEEEQSFQVSADLPENVSVRVGVNYEGDTGVLGFAGCPGEPLADIKFGNGDSLVLKACSPGTATVRLYQSGTAELLESYTVTIE